jgi:tetratricopeptide (TPR) repeat protein
LDSLYFGPGKVDYEGLAALKEQAREKRDEHLVDLLELYEINDALWSNASRRNEARLRLTRKIAEFDTNHDRILKAHALTIAANNAWLLGNYSRSFEHSLNAYSIYSDKSEQEFPLKYQALFQVANRFYYFQDYQTAKSYLLQALGTRNTLREPSETDVLNTLGLCYRNLKMYDSAVYYFREAEPVVVAQQKTARIGIIRGNLGITYYLQNKYNEAVPMLQEDIRLSLENDRATDNGAKSLAILGDIHYLQKKPDQAMECLQHAYNIVKVYGYWKSYELLLEIYPRLAKLYASRGNMVLAYQFMDSTVRVKDSLALEKKAYALAGIRLKVGAEEHASEVMYLQHQKQMHAQTRNGLIAGIMLVAIIAALVINRQQLRHNYKQERLKVQQAQAEIELKEAEKQLNAITKTIHEKNELIWRYKRELETAGQPSVKEDEHQDTLMELQQLTILTDNEWDNFRSLFEKVYKGFLHRLKEKIPGLSPAEVRFVTLTKLKFSNKEMAGVLGITQNAVRTLRSRLKRKLNLPEEGSIEDVIDSI